MSRTVALSMADIQRWDPEQIDEVSEAAAHRARTSGEQAQTLRNLQVFSTWNGDAGEAAREAIERSATKLDMSAKESFAVSLAAQKSAQDARTVKTDLNSIFQDAAEDPAVQINMATNSVIPPDTTGWEDENVKVLAAKIEDLETRIVAVLADAERADADLARVLTAATGGDSASGDTYAPESAVGLGDRRNNEPWPYPFDPPPPPDSAPGGGRWQVNYDYPYDSPDMYGPFAGGTPWHRDIVPPRTGAPSVAQDIAKAPPNGWGVDPVVTGKESYRYRLVGEGFNGAPDHQRWVQQNGKWYRAQWVDYDYEVEHVTVVSATNDVVALPPVLLGLNQWEPTSITDIYATHADRPNSTLYLPDVSGHPFVISPASPDKPIVVSGG